MKRFMFLVLLAVTSLALAPAMPVQAAEVMRFQFRGRVAQAVFSTTDGCIATDAYVFAVDGQFKESGGKPASQVVAGVTVARYNQCTGELLNIADGFTELDAGAFQIDRKLNSATLNTTVQVTDFETGETFSVNVDLSFVTGGSPTRTRDNFQIRTPSFKVNSRYNSTSRAATVTGSVTTPTQTFSPDQIVFAELALVCSGTTFITTK